MVTAQNVDFSGVKDGGGRFNRNRLPAGDYLATVTKVEDAKSSKDDVFQYLFSLQIAKHPSRIYPYYCKLQANQLWKLRNLLLAAGMSVPKKKLRLDPSKVVGKKIGVTLEDDDYDGKEQSTIAAVFPAAELVDGSPADDDDEPEAVADEEEEEEVAEVEEEAEDDEEEAEAEVDPYADLDRTALKAELKKRDSSFQARKSQTDDDLRELLREDDANKAANANGGDDVSDDDLEELDIDNL